MPGFPSVRLIELASRAPYVDVSKLPLETDRMAATVDQTGGESPLWIVDGSAHARCVEH